MTYGLLQLQVLVQSGLFLSGHVRTLEGTGSGPGTILSPGNIRRCWRYIWSSQLVGGQEDAKCPPVQKAAPRHHPTPKVHGAKVEKLCSEWPPGGLVLLSGLREFPCVQASC